MGKANGLHASITVAAGATPVRYDRMIFGQFIEHFHRIIYGGIFDPGNALSDPLGFRKDVIEALRELKVPVVRWPGGCFASAYHWNHGVGAQRTPAYDKAWHVEDPNTFGTGEFVAWCRAIGAEPYMCTNAGTGTAEEMSDWVEYCNLDVEGKYARARAAQGHPDPYSVVYWSIGNENYGAWEMGAKSVGEWGYFVREAAKLMRNVDPDIKLLAAALPDQKWTLPLLEHAGHLLDFVSIHGYWDSLWQIDKPSDFLTCMLRTSEPEQQIQKTIKVLQRAGCAGRVKIAFDEWNLRGWHHPGMGKRFEPADITARDRNDLHATYTMADALFSACFLNTCLRHCEHVKMACLAPLVNGRGALHVSPEGIVKRTTYHVMWMYANMLQACVLPITVKSSPLRAGRKNVKVVDVVVTCDEGMTKVSIAIINKHPTLLADCKIDLGNWGAFPATMNATILQGDSVDAYNSPEKPARVVPETVAFRVPQNRVRVPAHSLTIFTITR